MSGVVKDKFPPGPSPASRSGSFKNYSRDPLGFLPALAREYGDIVTMRLYKFRVYYVNHPDYIEEVLVNQARKFIKGRILRANKGLFGNGLLTSEGEFWLRQRRLAQPAFHRARIAAYAETMVRFTERMLEGWRDGDSRDVHAEMMRLTLQIVTKTLFDADVDADVQEVGRALEAIMEHNSDFRRLILTPSWLPTLRNIRAALATRRLNKIIYRIIGQRRTAVRTHVVVRLDGVLIDSNKERRLIADCVYSVVVDFRNLVHTYRDLPHFSPELLVFELLERRVDIAAHADPVGQCVPAGRPIGAPFRCGCLATPSMRETAVPRREVAHMREQHRYALI